MSSRVLLISVNQCATPDEVFPLGLAFVNAALRRAGYQTRWWDSLAPDAELATVMAEFRPDYVGVSLRNIDDVLIRKRQTYHERLGQICDTVHRFGRCPVILGGSGFSIFPEALLERSQADFGIQGEGETGLVNLLRALETRSDLGNVAGLVYREAGRIRSNPPQPDRNGLALATEDRPARLVQHYLENCSMLNVQTQRGCAHQCCYCTYPLIEGRTHRRRPPELVAEEMAHLDAQGVRYVFIVDSVFNSSSTHVAETCEALARRRLRLKWGCFARPQGLTKELLKLMVRAGLSHLEFGSDSFCDSVLASYGKRLTFADILEASTLAREQHVDHCHFLICGGPGESEATLQETYANSKHLPGSVIMAGVGMRIYPGTALQVRAIREGQISAETDLLVPTYYLAAGLSEPQVFQMLSGYAAQSPSWIVGDPTPEYARLVDRLRARGVPGPLWSYFAMGQRLWGRTAATAMSA